MRRLTVEGWGYGVMADRAQGWGYGVMADRAQGWGCGVMADRDDGRSRGVTSESKQASAGQPEVMLGFVTAWFFFIVLSNTNH